MPCHSLRQRRLSGKAGCFLALFKHSNSALLCPAGRQVTKYRGHLELGCGLMNDGQPVVREAVFHAAIIDWHQRHWPDEQR